MVNDLAMGLAVWGELWKVDEDALRTLDAYEGVPELYRRQEIAISGWHEPIEAYFFNGDVTGLEDSGDQWPALTPRHKP